MQSDEYVYIPPDDENDTYVTLDYLDSTRNQWVGLDENGNILVDATWLQRYVALMDVGVIEETVMHGDVDGDGDPTIVDATFIMRYCVGIVTPYGIGEPV